ncbi:hypothetical protein Tco_1203659 [Tanacetum coccineum]
MTCCGSRIDDGKVSQQFVNDFNKFLGQSYWAETHPTGYLQIVASIEQYSDLDEMTLEEAIGRLKTYEERIKYKRGNKWNNQGEIDVHSTF